MNTKVNVPSDASLNTDKRRLPGVESEVVLVILGLCLGIFLHYSRRSPWSLIGLGVLTLTACILALSLKYANPTTLEALHITPKRAGLYLVVGLLLIMPAWLFESLRSYLTGRGWLSLSVTRSPSLILSILAVATSEEVFFRGYLLGRLKSLGTSRWARIVVVSVVFMFYKTLVHSWEGWAPIVYFEFFAFGAFEMMFPTFWVDWTSSILTPIMIHIGWDLIMFQEYMGLPYWAL
jgi:membrane protease YdiL (CAAX protease family)